MNASQIRLFSVLGIILLGTIIYSNTFHAPFQFDDKPSIVDNYAIKHIQDLQAIWSSWPCRFLTYLSFAINYQLNHLDVFGYHLFNLVIHLSSAILVWWLVLLTLSTPAMKDNNISRRKDIIPLLAGLVFVSHPLQTEAVSYIVQRATSLATLLYLASLSLYVQSRLLQEKEEDSALGKGCYVLALITAVMTMFTKEMVVTLPLAILLYEASFLKAKKGMDWKKTFPFLLTMTLIPATMMLTKYIDFHGMRRVIEGPQGISPIQYLLTQFKVIVTYIRLLFVPLNQNLDYEYAVSQGILEFATMGSFLLLLAILFFARRLFSTHRLLSFSIFWFFLTLLPESSLLPIRDVIFEHRLYLPMVGYSMFIVGGAFYLFEKRAWRITIAVLAVIIACNSVLTYQRNEVWRSTFSLWDDIVQKSPHKERPRNVRGTIYEEQGHFVQAIADYDKAIELNPRFAAAYSNRGNAYNRMGKLAQAVLDYSKALEIDPNMAEAYNNRGNAYERQGHIVQAMADYNKAIELNPNNMGVYSNRASCYLNQGKTREALLDLNKVLELSPKYVQGFNNRANLYDQMGRLPDAIIDYTQAIKLNPNIAVVYKNRGGAYYKQGKFTEALSDFNKAIQLNARYTEGYYNRAVTYYQLKEYNKSWDDLHTLEGLGGSFPDLRRALQKETGRDR